MGFNPDEYLAEKEQGAFDPDEYLSQGKPATSGLEAGVMHGLSGATGGFLDEFSGAVEGAGRVAGLKGLGGSFSDIEVDDDGPTLDWETLRDAYKEARDKKRKLLKTQSKEHPGIALTSEIGGAIVSPLNKITKGMSLAKGGATLGGVYGLGNSEADLTEGEFGQAALDTGAGAGLGAVVGKGFEKVQSGLSGGMNKLAKYISPAKQKMNSEEIRLAAEKLGIKVTPGMLDDSGFVERLESSLAKSPSFLGQSVKRNQDAVIQKLNEAGQDLTGGASNMSPFQLGEKFKSGVGANVAERLDPISSVFDDVAASTKNIPIGERSKDAIKRNIENLDVFRLTGGAGKASQYAEMVPKLQNADQVKTAMTLLNKDIASAEGAEKQVLLAIKEKLSTLEKNSIMRGAIETAKQGKLKDGKLIGKEIIDDLREARAGYRNLSQDLGSVAENARLKTQNGPSAFLDSLEAIPSERVSDKFFNVENNRQLMSLKEKFPMEFDLLKGGKLKELLDSSIDNSLNGQGKFNSSKFLKAVRQLNPEAQSMLFGDKAGVISNMQTVQQSLPRNFNPSGTASEMGWHDALYRNVKDIPTYALYKGASGNLAGDISKSLMKSPQMLDVYKNNPAMFQQMVNQLEQSAGLLGPSLQKAIPRAAEKKDDGAMNFYEQHKPEALIQKLQGTKYAQALQNAADKGEQSFAAAHYVLSQQDPDYKKAIGEGEL